MVIDRDGLLARVDVLQVVERDLGPAVHHSGRWYTFRCPFHGEGQERSPSLQVTPDNGRWYCFGCTAGGTVIDWVMQREGLNFVEACEALGGVETPEAPGTHQVARVQEPSPQPTVEPPGEQWQEQAWGFVERCRDVLWRDSSGRVVDWLHERGLTDYTLVTWEIGYNERSTYVDGEAWGLGPGERVWLPRGVVIPCVVDGVIWYVKVNRAEGYVGRGPKYVQLRGSSGAGLYGAYGPRGGDGWNGADVLWVDEGEWNALTAWQETADLVDVVSMGSAGLNPERLGPWADVFLGARAVLVRVDEDAAGARAWERWRAWSGRARRVTAPAGGDTNGYLKGGGDVRAWIEFEVARCGV